MSESPEPTKGPAPKAASEPSLLSNGRHALIGVLLIYAFLILIGMFGRSDPPPTPPGAACATCTSSSSGPCATCVVPPPPNPAPSATLPSSVPGTLAMNPASLSRWKLAVVAISFMVGLGAAAWALDKNKGGRILAALVSVGSVVFGATMSSSVVENLKFDTLFKFDKLAFTLNVTGNTDRLGSIPGSAGIERLGCVGYFPTGAADLKGSKEGRCDEQKDLSALRHDIEIREKEIVAVVLIGSADRQPLSGRLLTRYDSNMGLARNRAEWVRGELGISAVPYIVLTTGPKETDSSPTIATLVKDRTVDVWVIWNKRPDEKLPNQVRQ